MTYFNPKSIQNFSNAANEGKFLKKSGDDIAFANASSKMEFVNFTGNSWDLNASDDSTFTYGKISADTVITIAYPTSEDKRELLHILRIDNTDTAAHTVTFQPNSSAQCLLLAPYTFNVYGNSSVEFIAVAFRDSDDGSAPVISKVQICINAIYGYEPYNATVNPRGFITMNDLPQSDWNQTNISAKDYIKNKPDIISSILFNGSPATVLDGIATITAAIPDAQVNSDWNADSGVAEILHKPTHLTDFINNLPPTTMSVVTNSDNSMVTITVNNSNGTQNIYTIPLSGGGGSLTQLPANWTENNSESVQYILNKPTLATVATSGNYNDLSNKPTIPAAQVNSDWDAVSGVAQILNKPSLSAVAVSGSYADLTGTPAIPVVGTLDTTNTGTQASSVSANESLSGNVKLHIIAKTGNYNDLIGKPVIPVVPVNVSAFTNDAGYITSVPAQVQSDWDVTDDTSAAYIANKPSLFSGSYNDLTDTPTIPAAQVNSDWDAVSGVAQILNKPVIPTDVSDLNNDAGYITASDIPEIPEDGVDYLRFDFTDNVTRLLTLQSEGNVPVISLEYKVVSITTGNIIEDWTEWTTITNTQNRVLSTEGPVRIYLRGDNYDVTGFTTSIYYHFTFSSNNCNCGGNLLTIYKKDGNVVSIPQNYRFYKLFAKVGAQTCNIKSAPYVKLYSTTTNQSSSTCFNYIFDGNTNGISSLKRLGCDVLIGSDDFNNSILGTHTLGTAIDQKTGRIYVEKPDASSYIVTLTYGDDTIDFSTLMSDYNAGKHIRCKDTVNNTVIYADLFSYGTENIGGADCPTLTFKYVESGTNRQCWIYKLNYVQGLVGWTLKYTETLDEIPQPSEYNKFLSADSNGLKWVDVIPAQVNADWNATSGVAEILNKPTIPTVPTNVSAFNNDAGYITTSDIPEDRTINHEQITDSSLGDINLHDGYYFPNAVQDYDGNWYGAVIIGDQVWLAEDLRTEHYLDGTAIQHLNRGDTAVQPAFYHYNTTVEWYIYNRVTASQESSHTGLVENFHVPTSNDITTLVSYITKQKRYTFGTEPNLSFVKAICSNDYWQSSNVENSPGNNPQLNNATGFNALPLSWDNTVGWTFAIPTKTPESLVGIYVDYDSSDWYINVDGATAGYTDYDILFQIRCLSNLTPIQFRNWYIKQYGTLQHRLNNGTADGTTVIVKNVTDNTPSIVENIYKDNLKHVILNINSLTQVYQGSLTLNAATSNDVLVGTPYTIVLKSDDNYNAKISIDFKVNNVSIPCYHQTILNINAGDAPKVINLRCYYPITNLFTLTEELS